MSTGFEFSSEKKLQQVNDAARSAKKDAAESREMHLSYYKSQLKEKRH